MPPGTNHRSFDVLLADLTAGSKVGPGTLGRVLARIAVASPLPVAQVDVIRGTMLARQTSVLGTGTTSRSVAALVEHGLISKEPEPVVTGPGRPHPRLTMNNPAWGLVGVHLRHRMGKIVGLTAVIFALNGHEPQPDPVVRTWSDDDALDLSSVGEQAEQAIGELLARAEGQGRRILAAGLSVGAHVRGNAVVTPGQAGGIPTDLGAYLSDQLGLPVTVENDVNALALAETYQPFVSNRAGKPNSDRDFVMIAVYDDGVGGALVIDRRLYRGVGGAAGEIGHFVIGSVPNRGSAIHHPTFADPCSCSPTHWGHLETRATPNRIAAELASRERLGLDPGAEPSVDPLDPTWLASRALEPAIDDLHALTPSARVFREAGLALGRGIAAVANIVNPGGILLVLPPVLARASTGTAGAAYVAAADEILSQTFSTVAEDARGPDGRLSVRAWPESEQRVLEGARAAALCGLNAFLDHARGRDDC